jgi:30S ribosomal protein S31
MVGYAPSTIFLLKDTAMGKGDRKTAKGKRNISSYGNARSNTTAKTAGKDAAVKSTKPAVKKVAAAKPAPARAPAKKTTAR